MITLDGKKTVDVAIMLVKRLMCNVKARTSFQRKSRDQRWRRNKFTFQVVLLVQGSVLYHIP